MLGSVLIRLGVVSDLDVARALSRQLNVPLVLADAFPAELPLPEGISTDFLTSHHALPIRDEGGVLTVVCAEPQNGFIAKALRLATGLDVRLAMGLEGDIEAGLRPAGGACRGGGRGRQRG
jgi:general secretion pathway protein E